MEKIRKNSLEIDKILDKSNDCQRLNVIYCRVSTNNQKNDLLKQKQLLLDYCSTNGIIVNEIFSEIASGMNDSRRELNKLINLVLECKVKNVYITYKDRLTRFGFDFYKNIFNQLGCSITVINNPVNEESMEQELTEDLISIIHHFSMKMYSNRRKKLKEIAKELENRCDLND